VSWIGSRWCRGRMPESGSQCVRPVSSEVSAMGSRPGRIEADDGGGLADDLGVWGGWILDRWTERVGDHRARSGERYQSW
jgi:hypothetical protein